MKSVGKTIVLFVILLLSVLPLRAQDEQPADTAAVAQLSVIDGAADLFYRRIVGDVESRVGQFEYRPYREQARMENFDLGYMELGFVPFVRSLGRAIYPNTVPAAAEVGAEAKVFTVPGEIEPVSFCIRTLDSPVSGLKLAPGGFLGLDTEAFIPPDSVEIGVVEYFPVRWGKGSSSREWRYHPVRIWPITSFPGNRFFTREAAGTFRVLPGTTIEFWVRIHVPRDAMPGAYSGSVVVEHWGGTYRLPVTLTVLPVELQSDGLPPFGAFIPGPLDMFACADLASHGIKSLARWYDPVQFPLRGGGDGPVADFRLEDLFMRRLAEAGINGPQILYAAGAGGAAFDSLLAAATSTDSVLPGAQVPALVYARTVQAIDKHATAAGWPRLVWGIIDRVGDWGKSKGRYLSLSGAINQVMGYRANLVSPLMGEAGGRTTRDLAGKVSVWMVGDEVEPDETMRRAAIWGFTALTQRDSAAAARERLGLGSWRARRDGMFVWAYNWSGGGHSWNDFDSPRMDWMLSYRNLDDTFLPTPAWEGIREGIKDRRYMRTLNRMINNAPAGSQAATDALRFLETIREPDFKLEYVEELMPLDAPQSSDISGSGLVRRAIAGFMLRLRNENQFIEPE